MGLIVYSCPYVPAELIAAYGLVPSRILPASSGLTGPVDVTAGVCPYMRGFVNTACAIPDVRAIILTTVCDQMRHAKDYVDRWTSIPSFLLNVTSTWQVPEAMQLYVSELKRLGRFLESMGGKAPAGQTLWRVMETYDGKRNKLRLLRSNLKARDYSIAIADFGRSGEVRQAAGSRISTSRGIPVGLLGGPLTQRAFNLFDLLERFGGEVVLDGTESGERTMPAPFNSQYSLEDDPVEELAQSYFGHIPDVFRRPNSELYKWFGREVDARGIRGVVLVRHVWCDKWNAEVSRIREWLKISMLDVDIDGEPSSMARNSGRIQSFMETLS